MRWSSRALLAGSLAALSAGASGCAGAPPSAADAGALAADAGFPEDDLDSEESLQRLHYDLRYERWMELHVRARIGNEGRAWLAEAEALAAVAEELYVEARFDLATTFIEDALHVLETTGDL